MISPFIKPLEVAQMIHTELQLESLRGLALGRHHDTGVEDQQTKTVVRYNCDPIDFERHQRLGFPEFVFGESKSTAQIAEATFLAALDSRFRDLMDPFSRFWYHDSRLAGLLPAGHAGAGGRAGDPGPAGLILAHPIRIPKIHFFENSIPLVI